MKRISRIAPNQDHSGQKIHWKRRAIAEWLVGQPFLPLRLIAFFCLSDLTVAKDNRNL